MKAFGTADVADEFASGAKVTFTVAVNESVGKVGEWLADWIALRLEAVHRPGGAVFSRHLTNFLGTSAQFVLECATRRAFRVQIVRVAAFHLAVAQTRTCRIANGLAPWHRVRNSGSHRLN